MLPSLSPLSDPSMDDGNGALAGRPVLVPPPRGFRPLVGIPGQVNLSSTPYVRQRGDSAAKEAGLRFEEKVHRALDKIFPTYVPNPQLEFIDNSGWRMIRPDGVLTFSMCTVAFEIKIQHMPEAWWQLTQLYQPVLAAGTKRPCQVIEVVRTYDPAMPFPCEIELVDSIYEWVGNVTKLKTFGVLVWRL